MDNKNLKVVSLGLSVILLALLFLLDFAKATTLISNKGASFFDATHYTPLLWLLIVVPIFMIALPYIKGDIQKYEKILALVLPIVGLVLYILLYFYFKITFEDDFLGLVDVNAGFGFYLNIILYIVLIAVNIMASKNVDFGNEKINDFVNKASTMTSETTDKVIKTVDKTVQDFKNRDDDSTK